MNTTTLNAFCIAYGHNYFRLHKANENTPELVCKSCRGYFKFENNGIITPFYNSEKSVFTVNFLHKKTA
ncbi:hypothetical protein SAMN04487987_10234 [Algibacter pectinivorans]|uniref:Uncharacterized protein n=1 Tax=Algibacter pectinivorans TaxID=870482 RepID=A0A1I1NC24_9FLAO|nr:hypothetical protein SAMN04487987_10234 [Algibacter pectinivorans]